MNQTKPRKNQIKTPRKKNNVAYLLIFHMVKIREKKRLANSLIINKKKNLANS